MKTVTRGHGRSSSANLLDDAAALVEGDDWLGGFVVQVQALLDGLLVVIGAAARLAALQEPLDHGLGFGVDVQEQAGFANLQSNALYFFLIPFLRSKSAANQAVSSGPTVKGGP